MFVLFIKVISPFFILLGLVMIYGYAANQSGYDIINAIVNAIHFMIRSTLEVFNSG